MTAHDRLQTEKLTDRGRAGDAIVRRATPVLERQLEDRADHAERIISVPRERALPLSPAQQRLWLVDELTSGGAEYNTGVGLRLSGALDLDALRAVLDALVSRHESLRTTFDSVDGHGVQTVAARGEIPLRTVDLSTRDQHERDTAV
ncbi:MAG: condensation domain-containing protein, partial [Acidobacteria bacterium]|nr:condensation domain-containing protein [Acidobacteriota bacterium]